MSISDAEVEAVAAKAFQKKEGVKWDETSEGSRRMWLKRYRAHLVAVEKSEQKKAMGALRAKVVAELWPDNVKPYSALDAWRREYVDLVTSDAN